jgi:putative transposase
MSKAGRWRLPVRELCRQHGFSEAFFYTWRAKFGGMTVSDAKRLRDLEAENAQLKKLSRVDQRTDTQKLKNHSRGGFSIERLNSIE